MSFGVLLMIYSTQKRYREREDRNTDGDGCEQHGRRFMVELPASVKHYLWNTRFDFTRGDVASVVGRESSRNPTGKHRSFEAQRLTVAAGIGCLHPGCSAGQHEVAHHAQGWARPIPGGSRPHRGDAGIAKWPGRGGCVSR